MLEVLAVIALFALNSYHIGNSLMVDGFGNTNFEIGPTGLEVMAQQSGDELNIGFHIDSAQSLNRIWANPQGELTGGVDFTRAPYGLYSDALPNYEWDAVLLEPFISPIDDPVLSTLGSDKQVISNFINLTRQNPSNADTAFYVYQVWPRQSWYRSEECSTYTCYWQTTSPNDDSTYTRPMREYYANLMQWLHDELTPQGVVVREIPTGEVWYRVADMIERGDLPGVAMRDFYRDDVHASWVLGRYLASLTIHATLFKTDPTGTVPSSESYSPAILTPELAAVLQGTVWDVVSSHRYAGISDFNQDGRVDASDLNIWLVGYPQSPSADSDGDGDTDGQDFLNWQRSYHTSSAGGVVAVPEPSRTVMLLLSSLGVRCRLLLRYRRVT